MVRKMCVTHKKSYSRNKDIYFWESTIVKASYLVQYDTLLQTEHVLSRKLIAISLQNAKI